MVSSNDLKNGIVIEIDGNLWQILDFQHVLQNKVAYVRVKMKNLRTGAVTQTALNAGVKLKKAFLDKKEMQYLYNGGDSYCFMDTETYEQVEVPANHLEYEKQFLVEGMNVEIVYYGTEILGINLPDKVTLLNRSHGVARYGSNPSQILLPVDKGSSQQANCRLASLERSQAAPKR